MNLSGGYTDAVPDDEGISLIKYAFDHGITFFDTADIYGANANEVLIGKVTIFAHPSYPFNYVTLEIRWNHFQSVSLF